jgi:hypothetical protein
MFAFARFPLRSSFLWFRRDARLDDASFNSEGICAACLEVIYCNPVVVLESVLEWKWNRPSGHRFRFARLAQTIKSIRFGHKRLIEAVPEKCWGFVMELKNIGELQSFLSYWDKKGVLESGRSREVPQFKAVVTYISDKRSTTVTTKVWTQMAGAHPAHLYLEEKGDLRAKHYHCEFNPNYQQYNYDLSTHALIVTARSNTIGRYTVTIIPTEWKGIWSVPSNDCDFNRRGTLLGKALRQGGSEKETGSASRFLIGIAMTLTSSFGARRAIFFPRRERPAFRRF